MTDAIQPGPTQPVQPDERAQPEQPTVANQINISPVSRARARPRGSRTELAVWLLMRITALMLFVLALAHFSILHFIWDPAAQNAQFIADERWNSVFWRGFDWLLLVSVLIHAFLGVRTVVQDYIHSPGARNGTLFVLFAVGVILFVIGTQVIVTLPLKSLLGPV